jgi:hypothetical protein
MASLGTAKKAPGYKGKVLTKKMGKGWQKKVYGKKYKYGTVKNLNQSVKKGYNKVRKENASIRSAKANLKKASGNATNAAAIQARLKTLEAEKNSAAQQIKGSKESRQKFLNLREKALSTTLGKVSQNEVGSARKAKVKARLDQSTTNGGTSAPNDSTAQNNVKPHKVNVGAQKTSEWGKPKTAKRVMYKNEGKKNKAQNTGGTTAR